jgi:DNA (cytosine-5)-methyltransferase 1
MNKSTENHFTFIDLFAGVGGFRLALENLGGKCVFSSEIDPYATKTYIENFGDENTHFGDITLDEIKSKIPQDFDMICGGFPCQAFSIAGYQRGFEDTRGTLFFDVSQIINKHKPKYIFLENVKNLISHDQGKTIQKIEHTLKNLGYHVGKKVLNSKIHANIPQNRERTFIVGFREDLNIIVEDANHTTDLFSKVNVDSKIFRFPKAIPLDQKIHDCLEKEIDPKYYYAKTHQYYQILSEFMKSKDTLYQWRRVYARENKDCVCPTLTANMGEGGHNVPLVLVDDTKDHKKIRKLTPRECFNFQGFPKTFKFPKGMSDSKLYKQAGNSVTTLLIGRIAQEILQFHQTHP